ncbi:MAG: hypothetical protein KDC87_07650, partial [Planctomycetes bacterium]|nr:hypothetical protein [Planctomycetota bacterium]
MRRSPAALLFAALSLVGCSTYQAPAHPRPALPLPAEFAERYRLPEPPREDYLVPLDPARRLWRGRLTCGTEHPEFHLLLPPGEPRPFLLCMPILAGGGDLMHWVAQFMAGRGYAVAWSARVESAMHPDHDTRAVERLLRRSVVHNRAILAWARTQPFCRADQQAVLGISTGGILAGTMMAVEPQLCGGVLILAGGDLPDLLEHTAEGRIARWRAHRRAVDDLTDAQIGARLRVDLTSDPARLAPYIPTRRTLLVSAAWDDVVPRRNQDILWEALGRPQRLQLLALGHYTAAIDVILPTQVILRHADAFLRER